MPIRVELYAAGGVAVGVVARAGHLREVLEAGRDLLLERASWHAIDGAPERAVGQMTIAVDDVHLATGEQIEDGPVHAQWHDILLDVGPYRVRGQMPTMPGFDPGRALARPTGEFVQIRGVTIGLLADDEGGAIAQPTALVNRYVVDRVEADLMLGFFFPGAVMITTGGHETAAAGVPAVGAAPAVGAGLAVGAASAAGAAAADGAAPADPASTAMPVAH